MAEGDGAGAPGARSEAAPERGARPVIDAERDRIVKGGGDRVLGMAGDLEVSRHRIGLPAVVAHLSDLHLDRVRVAPERVAQALDREGAEVVAVTGDFFDSRYSAAALDRWFAAFGGRPVVTVPGNHDHRLREASRTALFAYLAARSTFLRNAEATVGGVRFYGYDDPVTFRARPAAPPPGVDLVLAHSVDLPVPLDTLPAPLLCGHYHGGQVRILPPRLLARLVLRHERLALEQGILAGWTPDRRAYLSRGIGMSHLPVRLFAAPEVAVFD